MGEMFEEKSEMANLGLGGGGDPRAQTRQVERSRER